MSGGEIIDGLAWVNLICWGGCFLWMHRISSRQDSLLNELKEQGLRIEKLSKVEHDLIQEVHPKVGELVEGMQEVVESVRNDEPGTRPK